MTRFNITLQEGVDMVLWALQNLQGGEIFVPKIPSYRIVDVAHAIGPSCKQEIIGTRPGEKLHEEMITISDSSNTVDRGRYYAILPQSGGYSIHEYCENTKSRPIDSAFSYSSESNQQFLSIDDIRTLIREHLDPTFEPY